MNGSKKKMTRAEIVAAVRSAPASDDYVWDGRDEDDRPATEEELKAALESYRAKRVGRPPGSSKAAISIRLDKDVIDAFKADGPGWQTRMNAVLRDWLITGGPVRPPRKGRLTRAARAKAQNGTSSSK